MLDTPVTPEIPARENRPVDPLDQVSSWPPPAPHRPSRRRRGLGAAVALVVSTAAAAGGAALTATGCARFCHHHQTPAATSARMTTAAAIPQPGDSWGGRKVVRSCPGMRRVLSARQVTKADWTPKSRPGS